MKHRYVIFKSPSSFDTYTLVYVKSCICTQKEMIDEIVHLNTHAEHLSTNAEHWYYWSQLDTQYKPTED